MKNVDLLPVIRQFQFAGDVLDASPHGNGHIHETYLVRHRDGAGSAGTILQCINHRIFPDVPRLMANIERVTRHLRVKVAAAGGDPDREALALVPTRSGGSYYQAPDGKYWRAYRVIAGAHVIETASIPAQAREAGRAFGRFQKMLLDLPPPRLHDIIPDFHHTPRRWAALTAAIERDAVNRAASAGQEIAFAWSRAALAHDRSGKCPNDGLPERITHNDTKINNVLLDDRTSRALAVIDLDTVMPGRVPHDFGDQVRTTAFPGAEDEPAASSLVFRRDLFAALLRGYLDEAGEFLTPAEIDSLAGAGMLITFEIGIRFLTDYLDGDTYFRIHRPGHNLDRARVQFARVRALEDAADYLATTVENYRKG